MKFDVGRDIIKLSAIATMTIDHIGFIFYPDMILFRIIGRLAFPFFAYLIALGLESTKKPIKYILTLVSFGFISQIPYFMAFNIQPFERLNIFFSLFFGAITIYFFKKRSLLAFVPIILSLAFNTEGTFYVVLTVLFMNLLLNDKKIGILTLFALNLPFLFEFDIQILALFALPIIILHLSGRFKIEKIISDNSLFYILRKYFFYIYYPLHLASLFFISNSL
ncbi:MAG: conjugal transfer protein TraX [Candidatus Bathyarchaeota archaeon]|nr:conjugal transfer protein TraX [Candidatus Bathyarchaeota archaeon]